MKYAKALEKYPPWSLLVLVGLFWSFVIASISVCIGKMGFAHAQNRMLTRLRLDAFIRRVAGIMDGGPFGMGIG